MVNETWETTLTKPLKRDETAFSVRHEVLQTLVSHGYTEHANLAAQWYLLVDLTISLTYNFEDSIDIFESIAQLPTTINGQQPYVDFAKSYNLQMERWYAEKMEVYEAERFEAGGTHPSAPPPTPPTLLTTDFWEDKEFLSSKVGGGAGDSDELRFICNSWLDVAANQPRSDMDEVVTVYNRMTGLHAQEKVSDDDPDFYGDWMFDHSSGSQGYAPNDVPPPGDVPPSPSDVPPSVVSNSAGASGALTYIGPVDAHVRNWPRWFMGYDEGSKEWKFLLAESEPKGAERGWITEAEYYLELQNYSTPPPAGDDHDASQNDWNLTSPSDSFGGSVAPTSDELPVPEKDKRKIRIGESRRNGSKDDGRRPEKARRRREARGSGSGSQGQGAADGKRNARQSRESLDRNVILQKIRENTSYKLQLATARMEGVKPIALSESAGILLDHVKQVHDIEDLVSDLQNKVADVICNVEVNRAGTGLSFSRTSFSGSHRDSGLFIVQLSADLSSSTTDVRSIEELKSKIKITICVNFFMNETHMQNIDARNGQVLEEILASKDSKRIGIQYFPDLKVVCTKPESANWNPSLLELFKISMKSSGAKSGSVTVKRSLVSGKPYLELKPSQVAGAKTLLDPLMASATARIAARDHRGSARRRTW